MTNRQITPEILSYVVKLGPCQIINHSFPKSTKTNRSFLPEWFNKVDQIMGILNRQWLSYSVSKDRMYCIWCMLHGINCDQDKRWTVYGVNDWVHGQRRISSHEDTIEHRQSAINRVTYISKYSVFEQIKLGNNEQIMHNREVVKILMRDVTLYLARHCIAFRGHDENKLSQNRGNFVDLAYVIAKHNVILATYLEKFKNTTKKTRLHLLSKNNQNIMLQCLAEEVRVSILNNLRKSGYMSIIMDTSTDVAKTDQLFMVARYCDNEGHIHENLIAVSPAEDATAKGLYELFTEMCNSHNIDWRALLIGQSYDGANVMKGQVNGLRTLIQKEVPRAIYIWCNAHQLNLVIVDTCSSCKDAINFFGILESLYSYFGARKRNSLFKIKQIELIPELRPIRFKMLSSTRWSSHSSAIQMILLTFPAILAALEELQNENDLNTKNIAKSLTKKTKKFKFILMLVIFKNIFDIT